MSQLLVVRHGQARLFSADYDRLSALGVRQARTLAGVWLDAGTLPDAVWSGTLNRQVATAKAVADVFQAKGVSVPPLETLEGLNEYPADEIMASIGAHLRQNDADIAQLADACDAAAESERYKPFHRLLEAVISRWVSGDVAGAKSCVTWEEWSRTVRSSLRRVVTEAGRGERVAVFTSGGVIGVSLQTVLEAPDHKALELNWRIHNASVTRYTFSGRRMSLDAFNDVAHLPPDMLTYR